MLQFYTEVIHTFQLFSFLITEDYQIFSRTAFYYKNVTLKIVISSVSIKSHLGSY